MRLDIRWEDERERAIVEALQMDWLLYGSIHITNAKGFTRLDPKGVTYTPTGDEKQTADKLGEAIG